MAHCEGGRLRSGDNLGLPLEEWGGAILKWPDDKAEDRGLTVWHVAERETKELRENGKFAWIMDPDGNKVELWEPMIWDEKNKQPKRDE